MSLLKLFEHYISQKQLTGTKWVCSACRDFRAERLLSWKQTRGCLMLHLHSKIYLAPLASLMLLEPLQTIPSIFTWAVFTWFSSYFSSDSWNVGFLSGTHLHNLLNNQLASTPGEKENKLHLLPLLLPGCQGSLPAINPLLMVFTNPAPENINFGSNLFRFYRFLARGISSASCKNRAVKLCQ